MRNTLSNPGPLRKPASMIAVSTPRSRLGPCGAAAAMMTLLGLGAHPAGAVTGGTWSQLPISGAPQNSAYSAIYDPVNHRKVLFAGDLCQNLCYSNRVTVLDLNTNVWTALSPTGTAPPDRFLPQATYDPTRQRMLVIGGTYTSDPNPWALHMPPGGATSWQMVTTFNPPPPARYGALALYDPAADRMLLFGGNLTASHTAVNELWALNFADEVWELLSPAGVGPSASVSGAPTGVYDQARDRLVVIVGSSTWELHSLSGTPTWAHLADVSPPYYLGPAVLDPVMDRVLSVSSGTRVMALPLSGPPVWNPITLDGSFPPGLDGPIFDPVGYRIITERGSNFRFQIPHITSALNLHADATVSVTPSAGLAFRLDPPTPNPSSGDFVCGIALPSAEPARLEVFDLAGRRVMTREVGLLGPGTHRVRLASGRRLPAGVYGVALTQAGRRAVTRVVMAP